MSEFGYENPYEQYNKSIEDLKNNPELVEFDKLVFEVFKSDAGKKLLQIMVDRYLMQTITHPTHSTYQNVVIYQEGWRDFIRMIKNSIHAHKQRIDNEVNQ